MTCILPKEETLDRFSTISQIKVDDESLSKLYLTIDVDWASDHVIESCIEVLAAKEVPTTWFITHNSPVLERLREISYFELGIHPNFNFLLNGDARNGRCAEEVVDRLLTLVPEAKSVRSHSMTQSSVLIDLFIQKGLTHECNHFIPEQSEIKLVPWHHWAGIVKVPYFWEDDVFCLSRRNSSVSELVKRDGLKVFDFHPIHVFLNTETMQRYNGCRDVLNDYAALLKHVNHDVIGTKDRLFELIGGGDGVYYKHCNRKATDPLG